MLISAAYCTAVASLQKTVLPTRFAQRARLLSSSSSASALRRQTSQPRDARHQPGHQRPGPGDDEREQDPEPDDEGTPGREDDRVAARRSR